MKLRQVVSCGIVIAAAACAVAWLSVESSAQTPAPAKPSLTGAWSFNADLSDKPGDRGNGDNGGQRRGGYGRGGGGGGGYGRGGFGGGGRMRGGSGGNGGGYGGNGGGDPETMARMRDAMRDIMNPGDHLTIVETDSMIVITSADGRTTRLSADGKKVKDQSTNIERKTKWDSGKLVSEISGAGPGKVTQTFSVDPDQHQLRIALTTEGGRGGQPRTMTRVYDADKKDPG